MAEPGSLPSSEEDEMRFQRRADNLRRIDTAWTALQQQIDRDCG
jgi:hypothetical protein